MKATRPAAVPASALAATLAARVRGEVRFDDGSRALYATDSSNYRQVPVGVVIPRDADDVEEAVAVCREYGLPILARGAGTSLAGQACNVAVVFDFSKYMHHIRELDPVRRIARVEPGVVLDDLRDAAEKHHLTFGPDPSTHDRCTMGGMIGNDSCGVHSVMAGKTVHNVIELEVLTYNGLRLRVGPTGEDELAAIIAVGDARADIYARLKKVRDRYATLIRDRYPDIPRRVSGYGLDQLLPENGFNVARALVGSENNCVIVLEATLRLVPSPPARATVILGYPDMPSASRHVTTVLAHGVIGLEAIDDVIMNNIREKHLAAKKDALMPPGAGWLLAEFGADTRKEADAKARALMKALRKEPDPPTLRFHREAADTKLVWAIREAGLAAAARGAGDELGWPGWEDVGIAPEKIGDYLRDFLALEARYGYRGAIYGHFGDGCIHTRINFDLTTTEGIAHYRGFVEKAADLCVRHGGSLSGEHGDGQARGELLPRMYGPRLMKAFREFKAAWDPGGMMNPGKLLDADPLDADLRLGDGFRPVRPETHFCFPEDRGSFGEALLRCVGVGKCRRNHGGVMCPSYMATLEERHSTRGRARMLWEGLQGDFLQGGWRDRDVKESLDLCLACKGCKSDCPVNVDIATYKAEFLAHYYQRRIRPVQAYTMGLIRWWARLGALVPTVANAVSHGPGLSRSAKAAIGVAPERTLPHFAPQTFKRWFRAYDPWNKKGPPVVLWPDTFNDHFHPETLKAAVTVLEAAGYRVVVPRESLCCGRPLYDYGMLSLAKRLLRQVMEVLGPEIVAGVPVVGLEPSCAAVFRDELLGLFPDVERARRLSAQVFTFAEFLSGAAAGLGEAYAAPLAASSTLPQPIGDASLAWERPDGVGGLHLEPLDGPAMIHLHCHHKAVLDPGPDERLLRDLGLQVKVLDAGCCGMAGPFGFAKDHFEVSRACGERSLLPEVRGAAEQCLIVADGFSCREQIAQLGDRQALHLAQVVAMALHGVGGPALTPSLDDGVDRPAPS